MILKLIKIRFLQIYRELVNFELLRALLILLIIIPILLVFLYTRLDIQYYDHSITGTAIFVVLIIHRKRKDYNFLCKLTDFPAFVFFSEYLLFSIPLIIILLLKDHIIHTLLYVLFLFAISFLIPKALKNKTFPAFIKLIPKGMFEWQSGFRKNLPALFIFYPIGIMGIFSIWFSIVSIIFQMMIICSFYAECEPRKILEASEQCSNNFLKSKLINHIRTLIIYILPIFIIALINYDYWIYIMISFFVVVNLLVSALLLKYAYYTPDYISGAHQFFSSILILVSIILPISTIILLLNIFLYFKALRNLNQYLNAYD